MFGKPSACEINNSVRVPPQAALRSSGAARPSGQSALVSGLDSKGLAPDEQRRTGDTWLYPLILAWSWKSQRRASDRTGGSSSLFFLLDNHISAVILSADWSVLVSVKGRGHLWSGYFWLGFKILTLWSIRIKASKKKTKHQLVFQVFDNKTKQNKKISASIDG